MNQIIIKESDMNFGIFQKDCCFQIEKSDTYLKIKKDGIKIAEFLLIKPQKNQVWIIEAKKSSPRPETQPNFDDFIAEISEKMTNALMLTLAMRLQRHSTWEELPDKFKEIDLITIKFKCFLVIKGHNEAWLPPLQDALRKALQKIIKTLGLEPNSVSVINDVIAQKYQLLT
jgi:hypothetical protein